MFEVKERLSFWLLMTNTWRCRKNGRWLHAFLTSSIDSTELSASRSSHFSLGEILIGGLMGPTAGLNTMEEVKFIVLNKNPIRVPTMPARWLSFSFNWSSNYRRRHSRHVSLQNHVKMARVVSGHVFGKKNTYLHLRKKNYHNLKLKRNDIKEEPLSLKVQAGHLCYQL